MTRRSPFALIILVALSSGPVSCTAGDVHESQPSTDPSTTHAGSGAVMTDSGVILLALPARFNVAKVHREGDVLTAVVTYTGSCDRVTGRITVSEDHDGATGSVDIGPLAPDTPLPVSIPLTGAGTMTLRFAKTGCR
jgi:hypothetical protein